MTIRVSMEIYVTKYALTSGILKLEAEVDDSVATVRGNRNKGTYDQWFHGEGKDWHRTWESALARAEEMRIRKLQSLDKKMKKIGALEFKAS